MHSLRKIILLNILTLGFAFLGCSKSADTGTSAEGVSDSTSNSAQSAMSQASGSASSSEGGALGIMQEDINEMNYLSNYVDPKDAIHQTASACTYTSVRGTCSTSSDTIAWAGCTVDGGNVTMSGTWVETFSGTGSGTCTIPVSNGGSVTRTTSGSVMTFASGATLTTDTTAGTAWDGTSMPGTGETVSNTAGTRTITINGIHRQLKGPRGTTWFDHYITSTGLTVTGTRSGGNRSMSGTLKLYHNLTKYTATNTFNTVLWGSSTCCYPTSGSISTSLTGSVTGTTSLTFTSTCGQATYVDTTAASSTLTLTQCN